MTRPTRQADDPRFHRTLFGSLSEFNEAMPPCLIYVENGNFNYGYDLLALNYKMAADLMIHEYQNSGLGNWTAPTAFMVRQTLELAHKSLLEATGIKGNAVSQKVMFSHNLETIWAAGRAWLLENGYPVENDQRFAVAEWMTANFDAVDPSGDLFRFAHSTMGAYGRHKTYDRAGVYLKLLVPYFEKTYGFLMHWGAVLSTQKTKEDDKDWEPFWDPDDYPKIAETTWRWWPAR